MATVKKGTLTKPREWWKHLRPFNKRAVGKAERQASKDLIVGEKIEMVYGNDTAIGLTKSHTDFKDLDMSSPEKLIPDGCYCYGENGTCPFWDKDQSRDDQESGYCWFMKCGDWHDNGGGLLWDQCKECGINDEDDLYE